MSPSEAAGQFFVFFYSCPLAVIHVLGGLAHAPGPTGVGSVQLLESDVTCLLCTDRMWPVGSATYRPIHFVQLRAVRKRPAPMGKVGADDPRPRSVSLDQVDDN